MAASRKLQQEIERTIKRINEGCDEFDQIWDKVGFEACGGAREGRLSEEERERGTGEFFVNGIEGKRSGRRLVFFSPRGYAPFRNSACSLLPQLRDRRTFGIEYQ